MEIFSTGFLSSLLAIVIIDLVLAGDNAIVIALAARNLPAGLRTRAIVWGTGGAIAVRTLMTLVVVWLLKIPGLLLVGGSLLLWIAYKLLIDTDEADRRRIGSAAGFWQAMKTIVVADALMGLDNVLAVAGAAHGSFLLVVLGLLISIPIMIAGSQLILRYVQRYPAIVYLGAGVLVWTGAKMITHEPLTRAYFDGLGGWTGVFYAIVIGTVLYAGFRRNRATVSARVERHTIDLAAEPPEQPAGAAPTTGGKAMMKLLVPVDGTENSLQAVRHVITRRFGEAGLEIHLLHVRPPFNRHVARMSSGRSREAWHREMSDRALAGVRQLLDRHHVPYAVHVEIGDKAETIHRLAQRLRVNKIVMGTSRRNSLTRLLEDSVTNRVLEQAQVPVELIAGSGVSRLEKYGVPAAIGTMLLTFLAVAMD